MPRSTVRASELATFTFCQRAWHYARTGAPHDHADLIQRGSVWHDRIERRSRRSTILMRLGTLLVIGGAAMALFYSMLN
jgi:hypothetical protein